KGVASRVFGGIPRRPAMPVQLDDEPDKPVGPTRRLADIAKLPEISADWPGAKLLSEAPVQIRTADSAWGYSALFPLPKHAQQPGSHTGLWIEATVRTISGRAGLGLLLNDGAFTEERLIGPEDGQRTLLLPLAAAGQRGLLIRSAG